MTSMIRDYSNFSAHQRPIIGDTKTSTQQEDHMGWLVCDGRTLKVADFYMLWSVIGYKFGGSGATFNVPKAQGMIPGFQGQGTDVNLSTNTFALGSIIGEYAHRLTIAEMPTHNHGVSGAGTTGSDQTMSTLITLNDPGHTHGLDLANNGVGSGVGTANVVVGGATDTSTASANANITLNNPTHSHTIYAAGGSNYHNNIQPTLVIGNMFMYSGKTNYPAFAFPQKSKSILW
jgi:microcystin-dependent protein